MTIYFATDHAGYELKNLVLAFVRDELGYDVVDCGAEVLDPEDDYPDFISSAARAVSEDPATRRAIIFGGSGQGEAMVANKFPHVRAAIYYGCNKRIAGLSREHNDANILSIGARFVPPGEAQDVVREWLSTEFSGDERHVRRIEKIEHLF